jgi:D-glycero-alpha-D-manno-heptose 1-phosphate guanylyltransferase
MEAIVLAGGLGTRLRTVVADVPKPMAPVAGRPFLELLLRELRAKGITRAILSVGYMAETISEYFDRHDPGIELEYAVESTPLGTGGALVAALRHLRTDHSFVFNGDSYIDLDLEALESLWPGDRSPIVVARSVPDTERYGRIEVAAGRIARFSGPGTKGAGIINAGCYVVPRDLFDGRPAGRFSFEQDFLLPSPPSSVRVFICDGQFIDIGVPEDYRRAQSELAHLARINGIVTGAVRGTPDN